MDTMTAEEAERLDEYYTKNTILPRQGKPGTIAQLKRSMQAGEHVSIQCVIEKDGQELDVIFDGSKDAESFDLAGAVSA